MSLTAESIVAAVLCGGRGTRLLPVLGDLPKALALVGGRPFLSYVLDQISGQGVRRAVLCVGVGAARINDEFHRGHEGMELDYSWETNPLGTGGALRNALPLLDSDPVLALNGDTWCGFDVVSMLMVHLQAEVDVTVFWPLRWDSVNRPASSGVCLLSRKFLEALPEGPSSLEEQIASWPSGRVRKYFTDSEFLDIGTPETYAGAENWLAARGIR